MNENTAQCALDYGSSCERSARIASVDRFWEIASYLEAHWLLGLAVVLWIGAALAVALGTYEHWSVVWKMRRASRRMKELRNSRGIR